MRAENNWEDEIGKRLRNHEATPPPLAWNKINKEIKPRRQYRWWLWLPLLLILLISLPLAYLHLASRQNTGNQEPVIASGRSAEADNSLLPAGRPAAIQPLTAAPEQHAPAGTTAATQGPAKQQEPGKGYAAGSTPQQAPETALAAGKPDKRHPNKLTGLPAVVLAENRPASEKDKANTDGAIEKSRQKPAALTNSALAIAAKQNQAGKQAKPASETAPAAQATNQAKAANPAAGADIARTPETTATPATVPGRTPDEAAPITRNEAIAVVLPAATAEGSPASDDAVADTMAAETSLPEPGSPVAEEENKPEENRLKKWSVSLYGTPQYAYQRVQANQHDEVMVLRLNDPNKHSADRLGYELGLRGQYRITEQFGLEGGFHFAGIRQHLSLATAGPGADSVVISQESNGQLTMQLFNREQNQEYTSRHYLGGLYLGGTFTAFSRLQLTGGAGTNWLLSTKSNRNELKPDRGRINPYLSGGIRYEWNLNQGLSLQAGPVMQYYLKPMQQKTVFCGAKPVTFGLYFGLRFSPEK